MSQNELTTENLTGLTPNLMAALRAPLPRTPAQIKLIAERAGNFYRNLGRLLWCVIVLVPALVGFTSSSNGWGVFFQGLVLLALMFGVPVQIFVMVGRRALLALARAGQLREAVVTGAEKIGQPGKQVVDVTMSLACAEGNVAMLRVSGLPVLPPLGMKYAVLIDPARPLQAGVIAPPVGIYIASAQPAGEKFATREIAMHYADLRLRCFAATIDLLVLLVGVVGVAVVFKTIAAPRFEWLGIALCAGAAFAYFVVLEARYGCTIGKRLLGLKVVMLEGGGLPDWRASLVRNLLRIVDGLGCYLIAVIAVLMSDKRQRIGDRAAGTVVIRARINVQTEKP